MKRISPPLEAQAGASAAVVNIFFTYPICNLPSKPESSSTIDLKSLSSLLSLLETTDDSDHLLLTSLLLLYGPVSDKTMFRQQAYGQSLTSTINSIWKEGFMNLYRGGMMRNKLPEPRTLALISRLSASSISAVVTKDGLCGPNVWNVSLVL